MGALVEGKSFCVQVVTSLQVEPASFTLVICPWQDGVSCNDELRCNSLYVEPP